MHVKNKAHQFLTFESEIKICLVFDFSNANILKHN